MFTDPPPDEPPGAYPAPPTIPLAEISPLFAKESVYIIKSPPVPFCPLPSSQFAPVVCPENVYFPTPPVFPAPPPAYLACQLLEYLYDAASPPFPPVCSSTCRCDRTTIKISVCSSTT